MEKEDPKNINLSEEMLEIVDASGAVKGVACRSEVHGNPSLLHRVVHVLVFNNKGELLLQKRSMNKDVAPGKWDTSVGGHVDPGEDIKEAAKREMQEELGIKDVEPVLLYNYFFRNDYESELVSTFSCIFNGRITFNKEEIDEVRFYDLKKISDNMGTGLLSDNFELEIKNYAYASTISDRPFPGPKDIFMDLEIEPDIQFVFDDPSGKQ